MNDRLKKQLDRLDTELRAFPADTLAEFFRRYDRHAHAARLDAHHAIRNLVHGGLACARTDLIVLSGRDVTDGAGKATLVLDPLLCGAVTEGLPDLTRLAIVADPLFVATASGSAPAFVTATVRSTTQPVGAGIILNDRDGIGVEGGELVDVTVEVHTWKQDGSAAASTPFSWLCTIPAARAFAIGG
jgi:hypothetical protein